MVEVQTQLTNPSPKEDSPKVSVVTISFNQAAFLEQAIRSVVNQGYPNLEYIVIDGGSTDGSLEIIEKYKSHFAFVCSEPDGGPAMGLNKGFRQATGDIFAFLNADDYLLPGALDQAATVLRTTGADVVYGDGYMVDGSGSKRIPIFSDEWNLQRFTYGSCVIVQPATFFTAESYRRTGGFNETHKAFWDAGLWVDLALNGARFHHLEQPLAAFRFHSSSITGSNRLRKHSDDVMDELFQKVNHRPKGSADRILSLAQRLLKFGSHPLRTLQSKQFVRSIR